ncbi:MAG: tRNA pseudouridine(55) synthase TruB [Magnetococcales bacterium]|nr:tRNA pseudouridine(55) synthase TruB [Magnetococcales bacterium]
MKRRGGNVWHGWLAVDKPAGWSSFQVVARVRHLTGVAKVGHGGTLDPFAEGLLPLALGEATKVLGLVLEGDKRYRCRLRFGEETDSGDPTGTVIARSEQRPEPSAVASALQGFLGEIEQVPPLFSAIHVEGERAYQLARRGENVVLPARTVRIDRLELLSCTAEEAELLVQCGKGTYIRSLVRDLGRLLGCGATLTRLIRLQTLGFDLQEAVTLEMVEQAVRENRLPTILLPMDRVLDDIPVLRLGEEEWRRLTLGQAVRVETELRTTGVVRLYDPNQRFGAIGEVSPEGAGRVLVRPQRVFSLGGVPS